MAAWAPRPGRPSTPPTTPVVRWGDCRGRAPQELGTWTNSRSTCVTATCGAAPSTCRAPLARGPDRPVDARREPDQVAPGAHDLVLRDLRARPARTSARSFDPAYAFLFNSYYEAVGPRTRATPRGPRAARRQASQVPPTWTARCRPPPGEPDDTSELVILGLHHEQQHQELLLMDIKHVLSQHPQAVAYRAPRDRAARAAPGCAARHRGPGSSRSAPPARLRFDNELPRHRCLLEPASLDARLVTLRRVPGVHRRRRLRAPRALAVRRMGARSSARVAGAPVLVSATAPSFHADGTEAARPDEPVAPRQLLRGRCLRAVAGARLPDRGRVGGRRHRATVTPGALRTRAAVDRIR